TVTPGSPADGGFTVSVADWARPLYVAVIVTACTAVTVLVAIAKVTVVALAGTVTVAGTVATLRLLLASVTTAPPAGATWPSVTVPVLPAPPTTAAGLTLTPANRVGGFTVSVAVPAPPPRAAVRLTAVTAGPAVPVVAL